MEKLISAYIILFLTFFFNLSFSQNSLEIIINNSINLERIDEYIVLDMVSLKDKYPDFNPRSFSIYNNEFEIPYQLEDKDSKVSFVIDLKPLEERVLSIRNSESKKEFKSRTYAEIAMKVDYELIDGKYSGGRFQNYDSIRVPDGHTDHNALFKYEGPGWESDKVGYRYYIDWRNRIDIFGKKTTELVLENVGVDDREAKDDSYHRMQDWGMDIFKVGSSFGIGSYGMMIKDSVYMVSERDSVICIISENGPVKAEVTTNFYGWKAGNNKHDLTSHLSIAAGSRLTKTELIINNDTENLITGLAKDVKADYFENRSSHQWSYISLYGNHSLAEDNLGIALFYNNKELIDLKETTDSYTVLLKPYNGKITYYFGAAWEKEPDGIKTKDEFISYLNDTLEMLNNPVSIQY